jgi:hypothetical protein
LDFIKYNQDHEIITFASFSVYTSVEIHRKVAELSTKYGPVLSLSVGLFVPVSRNLLLCVLMPLNSECTFSLYLGSYLSFTIHRNRY